MCVEAALTVSRKRQSRKSASGDVETHTPTHSLTHTPADRRSPTAIESLSGLIAPPGLEPGLS